MHELDCRVLLKRLTCYVFSHLHVETQMLSGPRGHLSCLRTHQDLQQVLRLLCISRSSPLWKCICICSCIKSQCHAHFHPRGFLQLTICTIPSLSKMQEYTQPWKCKIFRRRLLDCVSNSLVANGVSHFLSAGVWNLEGVTVREVKAHIRGTVWGGSPAYVSIFLFLIVWPQTVGLLKTPCQQKNVSTL